MYLLTFPLPNVCRFGISNPFDNLVPVGNCASIPMDPFLGIENLQTYGSDHIPQKPPRKLRNMSLSSQTNSLDPLHKETTHQRWTHLLQRPLRDHLPLKIFFLGPKGIIMQSNTPLLHPSKFALLIASSLIVAATSLYLKNIQIYIHIL